MLGHELLNGVQGNDSPLHVAYSVWLDSYFPRIPHWYPVQGGGVSILHGYMIIPHIFLVLVHRLSGLSIEQTYSLITFLSFPLTALGIYVLSWYFSVLSKASRQNGTNINATC